MRKLPATLMVPAVGLLLAVVLMAVVNAASTSAPSAAAEPIDAAAPAPTVVSIADLDAAHAAVRQCLETAGYPVKVILPDAGLRTAQYTFLGVHDIARSMPQTTSGRSAVPSISTQPAGNGKPSGVRLRRPSARTFTTTASQRAFPVAVCRS